MTNAKPLTDRQIRRLSFPVATPKRTLSVTGSGNTAAEIEANAITQGRAFFDTDDLTLSSYAAVPDTYTSPDHTHSAQITVYANGPSITQSLGPLDLWADLPWYGRASLAFSALCTVAIAIMIALVVAT